MVIWCNTLKVMVRRALFWFSSIIASLAAGVLADHYIGIHWPLLLRVAGIIFLLPSFMLLRLSGRALKEYGGQRDWGVTTRLVTTGIYGCVRHPHHLGIGLFVSSLALATGLFPSLFTIPLIWIEIILFLLRVEEPELYGKFGESYREYSRQTPMIIPKLGCMARLLLGSSRKS